MVDPVFAAWIGAGASLLGAGVAWLAARNVEGRKGEIAKDAAEYGAALRVASERQLEVFKLAAESAEEASRALHDWQSEAKRYLAGTQTKNPSVHTDEAWKYRLALELAANKAGLFLPPTLDESYAAARAAQRAAIDAITTFANTSGSHMKQDWADCKARMAEASKALEHFVRQVREWKAREWPKPASTNGGDTDGG